MEKLEPEIKKQIRIADIGNLDSTGFQLNLPDLHTIISLLRLAECKAPLNEIMQNALGLITSSSRLRAVSKASIRLFVDHTLPLGLAAQYGFNDDALADCARFPVKNWNCEQTKDKENIRFVGRTGSKKRLSCNVQTGHYCVPITSKDGFLGIFNFDIEKELSNNEFDEHYLITLSEILSVIIMRRYAEDKLLEKEIIFRKEIKQSTQDFQKELSVHRRTEAELRKTHESITRSGAEEHALGLLLSLSTEQQSIDSYLNRAVQLLRTSVPWIGDLPKCGVFLADDSQKSLQLIASHGFSDEVKNNCTRIAFGQCFCGKAALHGQSQYSAVCCEPDKILPVNAAMPSGHYSVPIVIGENSLGVLVVHFPHDYDRKESDEPFLKRVADILSMGITRQRFEKEVEYLKFHDSLTGLNNRHRFVTDLEETLHKNKGSGQIGGVLFAGLANFKKINDSLGRLAGDKVLQHVAVQLKQVRRRGDTVARVSGNEFIVLLPAEGTDIKEVTQHVQTMANRIQYEISSSYEIDGHQINIETHIGIAVFSANEGLSANDVIQQASTAMQQAKKEGCNIIRFYHPMMQELVNQRFVIEQDLRSALDKQLLQLYFQPQVNAQGELVGAEALLRCPDAHGNMIRMDHCIEVAESTGLILQIGEWVLSEACAMLESWSQEGVSSSIQHLCVNISPKQLYQKNFVALVKSILSEYEINPGQLIFEITEGFLIDSKQEAVELMQELKSMGIGFAIDDFGTGYSSLSYLTQLPLDILKIDRAFVTGVIDDSKQAVIVETLIAMARQLGFETISEGVETRAELEFLMTKGCECFQGYYFSPPQPSDDFTKLLRNQHTEINV